LISLAGYSGKFYKFIKAEIWKAVKRRKYPLQELNLRHVEGNAFLSLIVF